MPTHRRGFALMFQDGQLFPHQSVAGNVGYPLRLRRTPARRRSPRRVEELLELVGPARLRGAQHHAACPAASGSGSRWPGRWPSSPGCCCSTSRCRRSTAALRERLAHDLRDILVAAGTTALLVTHDQEEAFAVADRMALMRAGRLVQSGTVDEVWRAPVDAEAARFLGYATVLEGEPARRVLAAGGRRRRRPGRAAPLRAASRRRRARCAAGCCPPG